MMQIVKLSLFSHDGRRRDIPFHAGLNLIVGDHFTGKTAMTRIIEYVLGRDTCSVYGGEIRRLVNWYGLLLEFQDRMVWVARRSPGAESETSNDYFLKEGDALGDLEPSEVHANTTTDAVVDRLTALIGITKNQLLPRRGSSLSLGEANIKHAVPFCLQPQDYLARSNALFYRQEEDWMGRDMRAALPYLLGAVSEKELAIEQSIKHSRRQINQAEAELRSIQERQKTAETRTRHVISSAMQYGLIVEPTQEFRVDLQAIASWKPKATNEVPSRVSGLRGRIAELHAKEAAILSRLDEIDGFLKPQMDKEGHLGVANSRMKSIGLLANLQSSQCPICKNEVSSAAMRPMAQALAERVKVSRRQVSSSIRSLSEAKNRASKDLEAVRAELQVAYQETEGGFQHEADMAAARSIDISRGAVIADARRALSDLDSDQNRTVVEARIQRLEGLLAGYEEKLGSVGQLDSEASILVRIGAYTAHIVKRMDLPHQDDPLRFDLENMTIIAETIQDGPMPLAQMGGAISWEGYHIAVHLALHREFHKNGRPIPSFLFLDQPSQVGSLPDGRKENRLVKMFDVLKAVEQEVAPGFQVIVTEHEWITRLANVPKPDVTFTLDSRLVPADWPERHAAAVAT